MPKGGPAVHPGGLRANPLQVPHQRAWHCWLHGVRDLAEPVRVQRLRHLRGRVPGHTSSEGVLGGGEDLQPHRVQGEVLFAAHHGRGPLRDHRALLGDPQLQRNHQVQRREGPQQADHGGALHQGLAALHAGGVLAFDVLLPDQNGGGWICGGGDKQADQGLQREGHLRRRLHGHCEGRRVQREPHALPSLGLPPAEVCGAPERGDGEL
mmetsp:Transcript_11786/g.27795  ORF Transcript_11786/g.27795 Transcript_11786/m.27795 type:complete len:209 (+) Transcript_11786:398-1024(+)